MRSCVRCKCMYEKRDMLGALCPFCSQQLRPTPAQEEKEMDKCPNCETPTIHGVVCHKCSTRTADLRQLHREAALAALSGYCANPLSGIAWEAAIRAADEFVRQYNPDAVIAEVVG
jgi:hypothetical protein